MNKSSSLSNISYIILTLVKTLLFYDYRYKFNIYFDNYFSNYNLFIELCKLGINAARTVSKKVYNFNRHIKEDRGKKLKTLS